MASIRDVAKEAGVASCTVSRVLNGTANVAPETQRKIEASFTSQQYGVGQAEALILFAIVAVITLLQVGFSKSKEVEA